MKTEIQELAKEAKQFREDAAKLKEIFDRWLTVLKDGNERYAKFEKTYKELTKRS